MAEFFKGDARRGEDTTSPQKSPKARLLMPMNFSVHQQKAQPSHSPRNLSFSKAERDTSASLGILRVDHRQAAADDGLHSDVEVDPAESAQHQWAEEEKLEARRRRYGPKCVFGKAPRDTNPATPRWYSDAAEYETAHLWAMGAQSIRRATSPHRSTSPRRGSPKTSPQRTSSPSQSPSLPSSAVGAHGTPVLSRREKQRLYAEGGLSLRTSRKRLAELNGRYHMHHPSQSRQYQQQQSQRLGRTASSTALEPTPPPTASSRSLPFVMPSPPQTAAAATSRSTRSPPNQIKLKVDATGANIAGSESKPQLPLGFGSRADRFGEPPPEDKTLFLDIKYESVQRHVQGPRLKHQAPRSGPATSREGQKVVGPGRVLSSSFGGGARTVQTVRGFYNTRI